jgi:type III secretory pathway component EscR
LKLNEINDIVSKKESEKMSAKDKEKFEDIYQRKMQNFRDFLKSNKDHVNEETVF